MIFLSAAKDKKNGWHKMPASLRLGAVLLAFFVLAAGIYLSARLKRSALPALVTGGVPAAAITNGGGSVSGGKNKPQMKAFASLDDFKSYLDEGNCEAGGVFSEAQKSLPQTAADQAVGKPAANNNVKNQKKTAPEAVSAEDGRRYFSLGLPGNERGGDIVQTAGQSIYFSPENQFYLPPGSENLRPAGETKIIDAADPAQIAQTGAIPQDGSFLIIENTLAVFLNNSLSAFDVSDRRSPREIWRARVNEGSSIIGSKRAGSKLYLAVKSAIDPASPCPAKPLTIANSPLIIDCTSIYHPAETGFADSLFTVLEVDAPTGKVVQSLSFVGQTQNSAVVIADSAIYAAWQKNQDQVAFFTEFLKDKCKSLLPNYLLEKTDKLPHCGVSGSAKEFELRNLLANWFASLSSEEQQRIVAEILDRLEDYSRDRAGDFEQTGIAKIDIGSFKFIAQTEISGRLASSDFMSESAGSLRVLTVAGSGAAQKMAWFATGNIEPESSRKTLNNAYLFDRDLLLAGAAPNLDMPAGICAARFTGGGAYVSTCRAGDPVYNVGFAPGAVGLRGRLALAENPAYLYPFGEGQLLAISKNDRKIKIALFDVSLPAKPQSLSEYNVNDYWADLDANYRAFAVDLPNKLFFLPSARGGYVFSYNDGKIAPVKPAGELAASRAFFWGGNLYLAGDNGIEVFNAADFAKIKSVKF
jgi:uncharacterized secreted protein with C-terminal beta-propeller domain